MALSLYGSAGDLFNRLGRIAKLAYDGSVFQATLSTDFDNLQAQYDSSVADPLELPMNGVPNIASSAVDGVMKTYMESLRQAAQLTVIEMVKADKPTAAGSIQDAMAEVAKQVYDQGFTLPGGTVAASAAAYSLNSGDGVMVATPIRGDGQTNQLIYPELAYVRCTADAQSGGATSGQENFLYTGEVASRTIWDKDYPIGSGRSASFVAIDATADGAASTVYGNLLTNSDFEDFTANLPDNWTAITGLAGTDFSESTTIKYAGAASLKFIGGATNTCLDQEMDISSGTLGVMVPLATYAFCFRAKVNAVPAAGVLDIEIVDDTGTAIVDDQGNANISSVTLSGLTTSWSSHTGFFRLPKAMPAEVHVRLTLSTALSAGSNLFVDHLAVGRLTEAYTAGVGIAAFSGATPFVLNDLFTLTTTNDYDTATGAGGTPSSSWSWFLDRMFNTRTMRLLFPVDAGSPDIANTLITA